MRVRSLHVRSFRNYADLSLTIPSGVVVLLGPNGQGKTNLVEALHLLLRGESFRPATAGSWLQHGASQATLEADLDRQGLDFHVKMILGGGRRQTELNGQSVTSTRLARTFPLVMFSPESLAAIKEGPERRRQLLDDVVMTHSGLSVRLLRDFQRALKTRNRVLQDGKRGRTSPLDARRLLESLDASFLPLAAELTFARLEALKALHDDFSKAVRAVLNQDFVDISVEYLLSGQDATTWTRADLLSAMHKRSLELRTRELETGQSLVGPQRHDIRFLFTGKDSRFFCSQGQQRALILSFKMAQILYHYRAYQVYPFLLLDDVLSELDPIRRTNLVRFLREIPAQIFLTTTDLSFSMDFGERELHVLRIENGRIVDQSP